jgi:hypothetical protein
MTSKLCKYSLGSRSTAGYRGGFRSSLIQRRSQELARVKRRIPELCGIPELSGFHLMKWKIQEFWGIQTRFIGAAAGYGRRFTSSAGYREDPRGLQGTGEDPRDLQGTEEDPRGLQGTG